MNTQTPQSPLPQSHLRRTKWLRVSLAVAFVVVLAVGFMGYLTPAMRVSWEAVASMCGF